MAFEAHAIVTAALFPSSTIDLPAHTRACLANTLWQTDAYAWLAAVAPTEQPPPVLKQRGRKSRDARNLHRRLQEQLRCWTELYRGGACVRRVSEEIGLGVYAARRLPRHADVKGLRGWISNAAVPGCAVLLQERCGAKKKGLRRVERSVVGPLSLLNHGCLQCCNISPFATKEAGLYEVESKPEKKPKSEFRQGSTRRSVRKSEQLLLHYGGSTTFPCLVCGQ